MREHIRFSTGISSEKTYTLPRFGINGLYSGIEEYLKTYDVKEPREYVSYKNDIMLNLGIGWIRNAGTFRWTTVEPQEGIFDFTLSDIEVRDAQEKNLFLLGNLIYNIKRDTPSYAKNGSQYFDESKYLEYLNKIVERYDGDKKEDMPGLLKPIKYWEIGNEVMGANYFDGTPEDYAHILKISYENLKKNCTDCQLVIGGWMSGRRNEKAWLRYLNYLDRVLAAGGGDYFDIMNYHEYTNQCDFLTYFHNKGYSELFAKYGLKKPIWITEGNTRLVKDRPGISKRNFGHYYTVERQAEDAIKRIVVAFDAGVDVYFWHLLNAGWNEAGLIDRNGFPKPCYFNIKLLIKKTKNFSSIDRIDLENKEHYFYRFQINKKRIHVLWTQSDPCIIDLGNYFEKSNLKITYSMTSQYEPYYKEFLIDKTRVPATSIPIFISESKIPESEFETKKTTIISLSITPNEIKERNLIKIVGSIIPQVGKIKVTITYIQPHTKTLVRKIPSGSRIPYREPFYYRFPNGSRFSKIITTNSDSKFSDTLKPVEIGLWTVKASWKGNSTYLEALTSKPFWVNPSSPIHGLFHPTFG